MKYATLGESLMQIWHSVWHASYYGAFFILTAEFLISPSDTLNALLSIHSLTLHPHIVTKALLCTKEYNINVYKGNTISSLVVGISRNRGPDLKNYNTFTSKRNAQHIRMS